MGGGRWSDAAYSKRTRGKAAFAYSEDTLSKPREEQRVNQLLDPFGLVVRESRDSAEHPESHAVIIELDVTGSMAAAVVDIRDSLGNLMSMLLEGAYILHPQLLFSAVGDATCDNIPFQVSQFESDIRINDQLNKVVLEGGGGGGFTESYELGFYCAARHTSIDCYEKRAIKGYLFSIGDEMPYPEINQREVESIFGCKLQQNISLEDIMEEVQKKYHTFHIIPKGSKHYNDPKIRSRWVEVFGGSPFVLMLEDPRATAETIAVAIGMNEGRITLEEGVIAVAKNSGQEVATAVRNALQEFAQFSSKQLKPRPSTKKKNASSAPNPGAKKKDDWKV